MQQSESDQKMTQDIASLVEALNAVTADIDEHRLRSDEPLPSTLAERLVDVHLQVRGFVPTDDERVIVAAITNA